MSLHRGPVGRGALELGALGVHDREGRQVPVEADEPQLREDGHQPGRLCDRAPVGAIPAKQCLELLAGRPAAVPQGPVERHERSAQGVLRLMDLLGKA